jgi:hypothetical protein
MAKVRIVPDCALCEIRALTDSGFLTAKGKMPYVPSAILKMIKAGYPFDTRPTGVNRVLNGRSSC